MGKDGKNLLSAVHLHFHGSDPSEDGLLAKKLALLGRSVALRANTDQGSGQQPVQINER